MTQANSHQHRLSKPNRTGGIVYTVPFMGLARITCAMLWEAYIVQPPPRCPLTFPLASLLPGTLAPGCGFLGGYC